MKWWKKLEENMKITYSKRFLNEIDIIIDFIANDSLYMADLFYENLIYKLESLSNMPYKFRQSSKFNDENIRDLIYKGYVIPYKIDEQNSNIIILGIYKENSWG